MWLFTLLAPLVPPRPIRARRTRPPLFRRRPTARPRVERLEDRRLLSINLVEAQPNDTLAAANAVALVQDTDVIVSGSIPALGDRDWFRVQLNSGDVFGAALSGRSGLDPAMRWVDASGNLLVANDNANFIGNLLPPESPLPRDESHADNAELYYVITAPGAYYVEVSAAGDASAGGYNLDLLVSRPGLEKQPIGTHQILFVDFDGATVNFSNFADAPTTGTRRLSPLASFLPAFGLISADENAVIDATLATIRENLSQDARARGLNGDFAVTHRPGDFDIEIRNSRDDPDTFGKDPFVARLVIGGSQQEAGFTGNVAGIAQFIDPGNFKTDDEAVVTLSLLPPFLNQVPILAPHTKAELIGSQIGNLASHEAGHLFGNFHTDRSPTDPFAGVANIMDSGGNGIRALGPDRIFGTADDVDLSLGVDSYFLGEPFRGVEDTLNVVAFGLSTGRGADPSTVVAISMVIPLVLPSMPTASLLVDQSPVEFQAFSVSMAPTQPLMPPSRSLFPAAQSKEFRSFDLGFATSSAAGPTTVLFGVQPHSPAPVDATSFWEVLDGWPLEEASGFQLGSTGL